MYFTAECWLFMPILNAAEDSVETAYAAAHVKVRHCIQRCIGDFKGRCRRI